ncbi:hypothetical protein [Spirosoma luteum]|uniref:hypothetical protein n=1 Tax=Spirosoma luteum TaxID=431553 RepID=UPI000367D517|nr:hypothetical protein [Spirosoma luteum]
MLSTNDYSTLTRDELVAKAAKMKSQKTITAVLIGLLVGIAIWSATHKGGFFLTGGLLLSALWIGSSYSKNLKNLQAEISSRDTDR